MSRFHTGRIFWLSLCLCVTWGNRIAYGGFITTLAAHQAVVTDGFFLYTYTLTNEPLSDHDAAIFFLAVTPDADLRLVTGPPGWDVTYVTGDISISWVSSDPSTDLTPGGSIAFSFESLLDAKQQDYVVSGFGDNPLIAFNSGLIASPGVSVVPEPSTLTILGTGILGLIGYSRHRRKALRGSLPSARPDRVFLLGNQTRSTSGEPSRSPATR